MAYVFSSFKGKKPQENKSVKPSTILCPPWNTLPVGRPRWNVVMSAFGKICRMGLNMVEKTKKVLNMIKGPFQSCGWRSIWAFRLVKAANLWPLHDAWTGEQIVIILFTVLLLNFHFKERFICFYQFKTVFFFLAFLYPHAKLSDVVQHHLKTSLSFILNACTRTLRFCLTFLKTDLFNESLPLLPYQSA